MRLGALTAFAVAAMLVFAAAAAAAQRYAAPGGAGSVCSQATPCSLAEAITKAKANDEVTVGAGTYSPGAAAVVPEGATNVEIHGDLGGPMPKISTTLPGGPIYFTDVGGRLKYLEIENKGEFAALCGKGGVVERVRVKDVYPNGIGLIQTSDCLVRDSLLRVEGNNSIALSASALSGDFTGVVRNITAIASGTGSVAIHSAYDEIIISGSHTLNVKNSIASGEGIDLLATQSPTGPGKIVVSNSNFDTSKATGTATVTDLGANQTAPPLFVDSAGGDYREAAGSPTIDAGVADQLGTLDPAGNSRVLGPTVDIGAFEFVPAISELRSITFKPLAFRAANIGGAVVSAKKKRAPVGSTVTYNLSAPATVNFSLERAAKGRRVGGECKKVTKANRSKKKCTFYKSIKGGFSVTGTAPLNNSFKFSGRVENRALRPGAYKLVGRCGTTLKRGLFRIVR